MNGSNIERQLPLYDSVCCNNASDRLPPTGQAISHIVQTRTLVGLSLVVVEEMVVRREGDYECGKVTVSM